MRLIALFLLSLVCQALAFPASDGLDPDFSTWTANLASPSPPRFSGIKKFFNAATHGFHHHIDPVDEQPLANLSHARLYTHTLGTNAAAATPAGVPSELTVSTRRLTRNLQATAVVATPLADAKVSAQRLTRRLEATLRNYKTKKLVTRAASPLPSPSTCTSTISTVPHYSNADGTYTMHTTTSTVTYSYNCGSCNVSPMATVIAVPVRGARGPVIHQPNMTVTASTAVTVTERVCANSSATQPTGLVTGGGDW